MDRCLLRGWGCWVRPGPRDVPGARESQRLRPLRPGPLHRPPAAGVRRAQPGPAGELPDHRTPPKPQPPAVRRLSCLGPPQCRADLGAERADRPVHRLTDAEAGIVGGPGGRLARGVAGLRVTGPLAATGWLLLPGAEPARPRAACGL